MYREGEGDERAEDDDVKNQLSIIKWHGAHYRLQWNTENKTQCTKCKINKNALLVVNYRARPKGGPQVA